MTDRTTSTVRAMETTWTDTDGRRHRLWMAPRVTADAYDLYHVRYTRPGTPDQVLEHLSPGGWRQHPLHGEIEPAATVHGAEIRGALDIEAELARAFRQADVVYKGTATIAARITAIADRLEEHSCDHGQVFGADDLASIVADLNTLVEEIR